MSILRCSPVHRPMLILVGSRRALFFRGPYSVCEKSAPHADQAFFELGVPILGICYGLQEIAYRLGKENGIASEAGDFPSGVLGLSLRALLPPISIYSKC